MAVGAEAQMDEIDDGRFAAKCFEFGLILASGGVEIGGLDGHGVDVRAVDPRVFEEADVEVGQVAGRVTGGVGGRGSACVGSA